MNSKTTNTLSKARLEELLQQVREKKKLTSASSLASAEGQKTLPDPTPTSLFHKQFDTSSLDWEWNQEQKEAIALGLSGKSFCLIGAAGTGKTTTTKEIVSSLIASGSKSRLREGTKTLFAGAPGIIGTSYTRRAVRNLRRALSDDMKSNCLTLHALLEYEPEYFSVIDETTGEEKTTMKFSPRRNRYNKLPASISTILIDESSMVSYDLFSKLLEALPYPDQIQFIFLGDLHQLPPVYGKAILGFKLNSLPVIELTQVYRQALESPIIRLAHRILKGTPITNQEFSTTTEFSDPKLTFHPWKQQTTSDFGLAAISGLLSKHIAEGLYNEEDCIILCPFNVGFGTLEINKLVAQKLGVLRNAEVHEIIAGFKRYYLAIGDRVLVDKEEAIIKSISKNARYIGILPQPSSTKLDRWGALQSTSEEIVALKAKQAIEGYTPVSLASIDALLESYSSSGEDINERKQEASHVITLELLDSEKEVILNTAAELNDLLFSYALTVHKSQGSEWKKVYLFLHHTHATMVSRELLYTAVTRAREELYIIYEPQRAGKGGSFAKGITNVRLKGTTWKEKAIAFQGTETLSKES